MVPRHLGLTKEEVRKIVLAKLAVVYRDWKVGHVPFGARAARPGSRRADGEAFETALVAGLLGGLSEAIEKNNHALMATLSRKGQRRRTTARKRKNVRERTRLARQR